MMKRSLFLSAAMVVALLHSAVAFAEIKIGVYNNRAILENLPMLQKEMEKLNAEFEPKQKELSDKEDKLTALAEDIEKNRPVLSQEDLQAKVLEFQSQRRAYQLETEDAKTLFNARRNDIAAKIQGMIEDEVRKVATEEQYDLVLRSGVLYASSNVDITQKVLKRLSEK